MAFVVSPLARSTLLQRVVGLHRFGLDDHRLREEAAAEIASSSHWIRHYFRIRISHRRSKLPRRINRRGKGGCD